MLSNGLCVVFHVNQKNQLVFKLMGCEHQEQTFRSVCETASDELKKKALQAIQVLMFDSL
jgi:hypothetical protein